MTKGYEDIFGIGPEPEETHPETQQKAQETPPETQQKARTTRGARKDPGKKPAVNGHTGEPQITSHAETIEVSALEADAHKAVEFLKAIDPHGHHTVVAISPRTGKPVGTAFAPGSWEEIEAEITTACKWNIYWSLNEPKPGTAKPPGKAEIATIRAIFVDIDVKAEGGAGIVAAGKKEILVGLEAFPVPPSAIVDSGNGYQGVWLLDNKLPNDNATRIQVEALGSQLAQALGGDPVQNVNRLLRLPWTVNHPDAKKLAKGRVPVLSRLVGLFPERRYDLGELELRFPPPPAGAAKTREYADLSRAEVHALEQELDRDAGSGATSYEELPQTLRDWFEAKQKRYPKLDKLWRKGLQDKSRGDGSAHVMALAGILRRIDDNNSLRVRDFSDLVQVWDHAEGYKGIAGIAGAEGLPVVEGNGSPRSIARAWFKAGKFKAKSDDPRNAFDAIEDAPSPEPSEPGKPPSFASLMARLAATRFIDNDD